MIYINVQNPEKFRDDVARYVIRLRDAVSENVLEQLAKNIVTTITSGIDRQKDIEGGPLKQNSPATVAKKLGENKRVLGDSGKKYPIVIGKGAKALTGGRSVRSLVDHGLLRRPSTYNVTKVDPGHYEVTIRAIKSGDPEDTVTRDIVGSKVQSMGYKFFGIPPRFIQDNVKKIIENELRRVAGTIK